MQISLVAVLAAAAALVSTDASTVHIRVHTAEKAGACPVNTYYDGNQCRKANRWAGECWNPALNKFQTGCARGFVCVNSKCDYLSSGAAQPPCYKGCNAGEFCEKTTDICRPAKYANECFNYAIGYFQEGCDNGFECRNSKCELKQGGGGGGGNNNTGKCLNPATGKYIDKCDPGFVCRNGRCDYA